MTEREWHERVNESIQRINESPQSTGNAPFDLIYVVTTVTAFTDLAAAELYSARNNKTASAQITHVAI